MTNSQIIAQKRINKIVNLGLFCGIIVFISLVLIILDMMRENGCYITTLMIIGNSFAGLGTILCVIGILKFSKGNKTKPIVGLVLSLSLPALLLIGAIWLLIVCSSKYGSC